MDQAWFEMADVRRRKLANAVWIPLRAVQKVVRTGTFGHAGFKEEFYGVGTVAVPTEKKSVAEKWDWTDVGIGHEHAGHVDKDRYVPADVYLDYEDGNSGVNLILNQRGNSAENSQWHLHQDLSVTLGLKRECDL